MALEQSGNLEMANLIVMSIGLLFALTISEGLKVIVACITRRDPEICVPNTHIYLYKRKRGLITIWCGLLGWVVCISIVVQQNLIVTGLFLTFCLAVIAASLFFQRQRLEPGKKVDIELHDDNAHDFDLKKFIRQQRAFGIEE